MLKIKLNGKTIEKISRNDLKNTFSPKHHKPVYRPGYKGKYLAQVKTNKGLLLAIGILLAFIFALCLGFNLRVQSLKKEQSQIQKQLHTGLTVIDGYLEYVEQLESGLASCSAKLPKPKVSTGKVSYYSHDGCIGCSPNQTMANGQPFDENAMTLAHNGIPLNTMVEVKNLDNGKTITAKVTDRGGFNRYNRVADLSKGLYLALGAKTDVSNIQFIWY
jgi:hypothetical protein